MSRKLPNYIGIIRRIIIKNFEFKIGQVVKLTYHDGIDYIIAVRFEPASWSASSICDKFWFKWLTRTTITSQNKLDEIWQYETDFDPSFMEILDEKESLPLVIKYYTE